MDARLAGTRLPSLGLYGTPYPSPAIAGYLPYGTAAAAPNASTLYSGATPGDNTDAWRIGLSRVAAAYYDPNMAAHYGYGGFGPIGLCDGARRKNATRETTSTLKSWLNEHRKNPYPTKGEKIMLAIITKMTLTQVSTWFANARRRLKKENKMTWSPRNRCEDDDEEDDELPLDDLQINGNSHCRTPSSMSSLDSLLPQTFGQKQPSIGNKGGEDLFNDKKSEGQDKVLRMSPNDKQDYKKKAKEQTATSSEQERSSSNESKKLASLSRLSKQSNDSYSNQGRTRSFDAFATHLSPTLQSAIARPSIPISTSISHFSGAPLEHNMISGPLSHAAAAASIMAASRGHSLPSHILAALNEQIQYQKALQAFPVNPFRSAVPEDSKLSLSTPSNPPSLGSLSHESSSSSSSAEQRTIQEKPKIWSLANVATSNESSNNLQEEQLLLEDRNKDACDNANIRNRVDNVMPKNISMAASGQYGFGSELNRPQGEKLNPEVNPNGINCSISQNRFSQKFQELVGLASLPHKTHVEVKASTVDLQWSHHTQAIHETESSSSNGRSVNVLSKTTKSSSINRYVSTPSGSQCSGSISEATST